MSVAYYKSKLELSVKLKYLSLLSRIRACKKKIAIRKRYIRRANFANYL